MASKTKYAGSISQVTGAGFASFSNLNNLKNNADNSWATTGTIKGKSSSPNEPSTLSFSNFGFSLPVGAEPTRVIVTYRHKRSGGCNVPAPIITLLGTGSNTFSTRGSAPTGSMVTHEYKCTTGKITRAQVNSSSFGVKLDYPKNTNSGEGTVSLSYVRVTVEYKTSSYSLQLSKVSGGYNEEQYVLEASISNVNFTSYNPSVTLSAPSGFSFSRGSGSGSFSRVNNRTVVWNPKLSGKVGTASCRFVFDVSVTFPVGVDSYTGTFSLVESLNSATKTHTAVISVRPTTEEEESPDNPVIDDDSYAPESKQYTLATVNDEISGDVPDTIDISNLSRAFCFPLDNNEEPEFNQETTPSQIKLQQYNIWLNITEWDSENNDYGSRLFASRNSPQFNIRFSEVGRYVVYVYKNTMTGAMNNVYWSDYENDDPLATLYFEVRPEEEDLTIPNFTILELSNEELNRLGNGYKYIVQSDLKNTTTDTYTRNWYKNYRIGVYNNQIEGIEDYTTLTNEQIYTNAQYWSDDVAGLNDYANIECEFTFNEDYPVYVIITGDYTEATTYNYNIGEISFTEPSIIQKDYYNNREPNGNYPIPILETIGNDDTAQLIIPPQRESTPIILYNFPVSDDFGTNENYAIRGIQVNANIEQTDPLSITAKLVNPDGETGQRSIILDSTDVDTDSNITFEIGGLGDLWSFSPVQLTNLKTWEIHLSANNLLNNTEATINFNNLTITFYLETIDQQLIGVKVEDENLSAYGAFIDTVNIPEGLNTDTSYINVNGTDINDAYRQNIREKTIEIGFNINECDLKTSTDMLRQITKLLVNEKDQYNRPIPKTITFTHYPKDYYEYIMETPLEITNEISGYNVKAKLTIPAGTSYSIHDTITNTVGYVQGLAAIKPIITIQPNKPNIEIKETLTGQTFNMGYTNDWNNKIVMIDCDNRRVLLKTDDEDDEGLDISKYVDHNVDWFRLYGEYSFEGVNCIIRTVTFNERW